MNIKFRKIKKTLGKKTRWDTYSTSIKIKECVVR